jgi:hypothetical protein
MSTVPWQNRPVVEGAVVLFDNLVAPLPRSRERTKGTLHLPKLALVRSERES